MDVTNYLHVTTALTSGKKPSDLPLYRRMGEPLNRPGQCREEKNILPRLELNPELSVVRSLA
jgi:hypothetical protein